MESGDGKKVGEQVILKMPRPLSKVQVLQAMYDAELAGVPPDVLQITVLGIDEASGRPIVQMHTKRQDVFDDMRKHFKIILHTGEDQPRTEVLDEREPESWGKPGPKLWTKAEGKRRTKPKSNSPDVSDR